MPCCAHESPTGQPGCPYRRILCMGDWKPQKEQATGGEKIFLWKMRRKFLFFD